MARSTKVGNAFGGKGTPLLLQNSYLTKVSVFFLLYTDFGRRHLRIFRTVHERFANVRECSGTRERCVHLQGVREYFDE